VTRTSRTPARAAVRHHPGRLLVTCEGVDARDDADSLRGELLTIPFEAARELGPGEFWRHQLVGLTVVDAAGAEVGSVADVVPGAAHDLLQVRLEQGGEALVPAVAALVTVELDARRVVVADVPGLLEP
jgi:16S rRNA processing protein RimM